MDKLNDKVIDTYIPLCVQTKESYLSLNSILFSHDISVYASICDFTLHFLAYSLLINDLLIYYFFKSITIFKVNFARHNKITKLLS